jgi:hypothetical protein
VLRFEIAFGVAAVSFYLIQQPLLRLTDRCRDRTPV